IGNGEEYSDLEYQDQVESRALYDLLEGQIVPLFYQRGPDGVPKDWVKRMKLSMQTLIPHFSATRMVREYSERFYLPSSERWLAVNEDGAKAAKELWDWKMGLFQRWAQIRIEDGDSALAGEIPVGGRLDVGVKVHLGPVDPAWV